MIKTRKNTRFFKVLSLFLSLGLILSLASCGGKENPGSSASGSDNTSGGKLKVVCTIFPVWDWTREILQGCEDETELTLLLNNGTDLHSFQPSVSDILKIREADVFIYVGGESDNWVKDALKDPVNPDRATVNLMEVLGDRAKKEEMPEGAEEDPEDSEEEEEDEYDEHVWLSLKNAVFYTEELGKTLAEACPKKKETIVGNAASYTKKISDLEMGYREVTDDPGRNTLVFGDRYPFRYLAEDYGLQVFAAFSGCSAETEASFKTITYLAEMVDRYELSAVLIIDGSDGKLARTIIDNTKNKNAQVLTVNSLQSVTRSQIESGVTYLSVMEENLGILQKALR